MASMTVERTAVASARERILASAYELFTRRGVRAVGVDEVIAHAGVAKASLYRHFASKDDLVLAFLAEREQRWTQGLVQAGIRARGRTAEQQLLAVFDVFAEWFARPEDFEACSFINVLLEMGPAHPAGQASMGYLADIRSLISELAAQAGLEAPVEFAHSFHLLMKGSIIAAAEGDLKAAGRAKDLARCLLRQYRGTDFG